MPDRAITGLAPRPKPAAGALLKQNRPAAPQSTQEDEPDTAAAPTPADPPPPSRARTTKKSPKPRATS
ncbi:hypothetical protein AAG589_21195, partial [Isoptericola sp. F-RaC21]|uniref:hypothetical protein n=1 Tax=Isoptericola sp. F-RaC21 TaxID=3141452 RepID=UPI00315BE0C7